MPTNKRRATFMTPTNARRPMYYFTLPAAGDPNFESYLQAELARCRRSGCSTLIPQLPMGTALNTDTLANIRAMYAFILRRAEEWGLTVGFYCDLH